MVSARSPRFPTPVAALRFYFRASELLADKRRPGSYWVERHSGGCANPNALCDFLALDSCFDGMDDFQVWLLRELYGPCGFGRTKRTMSRISEAAQRKFPELRPTPRMMARSREQALERVQRQLLKEDLM